MTQALFLDETGGPENFALRAHDLPPPPAGVVQIRHHYIGLNFIDIYKRTGLYPVSLPAILGEEAVGVVEAVGPDISGFKPGDRVAYIGAGAYAEAANVPAALCAKIPDSVSDEDAAAGFLKGLTVEMLLRKVFPLTADHSCLVHAAAGGVGTLLCQWAVHIGAKVIAVVGTPEKADSVRALGVEDIIVRTETDSLSAAVRAMTDGRGVDVAYDSVGAATFEASLDSLAPLGHMVTYGNASGPPPAISPLDLARRGSLTLTRPTLFHYATPDHLPAMAGALFGLMGKGDLKPAIAATFPLHDIAKAHQLLESGKSQGSILIKP